MAQSLEQLLSTLEETKRRFQSAELERLLTTLERRRFHDAASLIRFHEALLFVRAYPPNAAVLRLADRILFSIARRVQRLCGDLTPFEEPEVSGIAGTSFSAVFSYPIARWLRKRVRIDWEGYDGARLAGFLRHVSPLVDEDALVEANVPYLDWFQAVKGRAGRDLDWLITSLDRLGLTDTYDSLGLPLAWELGDSFATRSRMRMPVSKVFYQRAPLIRRDQVSLAAELDAPPLEIRKLTQARGAAILAMARDTSAARYRELHGFTYGDADRGIEAGAGRGVRIFVFGVPPEHRLPLRVYHAGLIFKNGVPIGYVETLSFFDLAEVGFNMYYTFREGESAWLYARTLRLCRQLFGVSCFSVDPYQIGYHNEEAIESGAFWFYRKLGFRPARPELELLAEKEELRIRTDTGYRSPAKTLRRLSAGHMLFEGPGAAKGAWNGFRIRDLALAAERKSHGRRETGIERVFAGIDQTELERILRAKRGPDEARYLRLLQKSPAIRKLILGSVHLPNSR